jgi:hypothetical protein
MLTPYALATWSTAKVGPDIHAKSGTLYSTARRYLECRHFGAHPITSAHALGG